MGSEPHFSAILRAGRRGGVPLPCPEQLAAISVADAISLGPGTLSVSLPHAPLGCGRAAATHGEDLVGEQQETAHLMALREEGVR
jgi:hypothetical protein